MQHDIKYNSFIGPMNTLAQLSHERELLSRRLKYEQEHLCLIDDELKANVEIPVYTAVYYTNVYYSQYRSTQTFPRREQWSAYLKDEKQRVLNNIARLQEEDGILARKQSDLSARTQKRVLNNITEIQNHLKLYHVDRNKQTFRFMNNNRLKFTKLARQPGEKRKVNTSKASCTWLQNYDVQQAAARRGTIHECIRMQQLQRQQGGFNKQVNNRHVNEKRPQQPRTRKQVKIQTKRVSKK